MYKVAQIDKLRTLLQDFCTKSEEMSVASLKGLLGVSRKQAVPLLEWSDWQRWTERRGDIRVAGPNLREGSA